MPIITTLLPPPSTSPSPAHTLLQVPPLAGAKLTERFLRATSHLETLKREWGVRALDQHAIATAKQCQQLEEAYKENVMGMARKLVAKQQLRELARIQMENVSGGQ